MDGPIPSNSKRCSWCGALNSASEHACAKCGAVLSAIQPSVDAHALDVDSPLRAEATRASPYQEVNASAFDSSLLDKQTTEAIRSLGLGPSFESGGTRAFVVAGFLSLYILLSLAGLLALSKAAAGPTVPRPEVTEIDAQALLIRLAQVFIVPLTAAAFFAWIYRAYKNLKALGATDLKFSPGSAIGSFFIPFLNIVRPYQVVTEIWRASGYEAARSGRASWSHAETPIFIAVWWGSWLTLGLLGSLGVATIFGATGADQLSAATRYLMVYYVLGIACAALAITVVLKINARQESANRLIWSTTLQDSSDSLIPRDQL